MKRFKPTSVSELQTELLQLHQQVLHLSSKRTSEQEKKLGLEKALKLYKWLVPNMDKFLSELDATYRALWMTEEGVQGQVLGPTAPAGPSLLAAIIFQSHKLRIRRTFREVRETRTIHSASLRQQPLLQCWSDVELLDSLLDGRLLVGSLHTAQQRGWGAFDVVDRPGVELGRCSADLLAVGDFMDWGFCFMESATASSTHRCQ